MEAAESKAEPTSKKNAKSSRWLPLAVSTLAAGLMIGLAYYALQYFRSSTVSDERGFRVLREMIGQFGNFQEAIAGLLTLVPAGASDAKIAPDFVKTLSLSGRWTVAVSACDAGANDKHAQLFVDTKTPSRDFTMSLCLVPKKGAPRKNQLSESLARQLPTFLGQEFFDVVTLAMADGTTLASVRSEKRDKPAVELHKAETENLVLTNVSGLLRDALEHEARSRVGDAKSTTTSNVKVDFLPHPVVLSDTIAGESYRVFIQPFEPAYRVTAPEADGSVKQASLYLIGLKRQDVLHSLIDTLGSTGTLVITLIVILVVLSWPLISLKFASPREPIAAMQVFAAIIALLLIPSVIVVAGFSVWSRHRLELWADQAAELYARNVEAALLGELSDGARTLDNLAAQFTSHPQLVEADFDVSENANVACVAPEACEFVVTRPPGPMGAPGRWSPWRSAAPLNLSGQSAGLTINLFGGPAQVRPLDLQDREYFKAIANGEEWRPSELWSHRAWQDQQFYRPLHGLIAQRLFNRSDAARVLQIAVPIHESGQRRGVMTADGSAYSLTAGARPPLLRFAIIDSANGAVLFHSDDSRSLAENLLVETEQNASLREAMHKRRSGRNIDSVSLSDHFDSPYLGEHHRFFYRPASGLPWGIVIFYASEDLAEMVLQTAVATLATSIAFAGGVILLLSLLVFVLPGRPEFDLLAIVWPKWHSRPRYRSASMLLSIVVLAGAFLLIARLLGGLGAVITILVCAAVACFAVIVAERRRRRLGSKVTMSIRGYEKYYVASMLAMLCAISALPTIWLAVDYHDVSVAAFMRGELRQAATDVHRRYRTIAQDLERFMPSVRLEERLDIARRLRDSLRVPGFDAPVPDSNGAIEWVVVDAQPGLWLRKHGPASLGAVRRIIWTLSTSEQAQRARRSSEDSDPAGRDRKSSNVDGEPRLASANRYAVRYWLRGEDGHRIKMALPLATSTKGATLRRDDELIARYQASSGLVLVSVIVVSLVMLTLMCWHAARRLFGIRIPFSGRFLPKAAGSLDVERLLDCELQLLELKKNQGDEFTWKDETDWRTVHCHEIYASAWSTVKPDERLLMHQLANGYFANPENAQIIEGLLRRGYLKLWPWPKIVETGFADYIRKLDDAEELQQLQQQASQHLWHRIRTPLLIVVIVVAGLLMWLAGNAMQILSATLAGIAALFSSITQVTSFANKNPKGNG